MPFWYIGKYFKLKYEIDKKKVSIILDFISELGAAESSTWIENAVKNISTQGFWVGVGYRILEIIIVALIAYIITKVAKVIVRKLFKVRKNSRFSNQRTITLMQLVENVSIYVIDFLVIATALETIGIRVTGLLAGAGILGLAVGFGAQNLVKDIITGFFIILEDQLAIGDYVNIDQTYEGFVEEIGLRTIKIKGSAGEVHILPNGSIPSVTNFSRHNSVATVDISISYECDIKYAEAVIEALLQEMPDKYEDLVKVPELLGVQTVGQNEVVLRVIAEAKPMTHNMVARSLRKEIKMRLDQKGIEVPYPHMIVLNNDSEGKYPKKNNVEG